MSHMKWLSKKFYSFHLLRGAIQGLHMIGFILFYISLSANACNPKYEACAVIKDRAMELKSAEKQCEEIRRYGSCVDVGLRDCREGNFDNTYALRIESIYCATGYRCLQDLRQCYENVTDVALLRITNTARDQRSSLCWTYVIPIMSCQDKVLEECRDQVGLLEEISLQQQNLLDVCEEKTTCIQKAATCLCHISKSTSLDQTSMYRSICHTYPLYESCIQRNVESRCYESTSVSDDITTMLDTYVAPYDLLCTDYGGLCVGAVQCIFELNSTSSVSGFLDLDRLCRSADTLFECLELASDHCGPVRPLPSVVDFISLRDHLLDDSCPGTSINVEIRQGGEQGGSYDSGHLGKGKQTDGGCRGSLKINTRMAMVSLLFAYTLNCLLDHCSSFHTVTWG